MDTNAYIRTPMNKTLKSGFAPFQNEQSLRAAIESVCAKYGTVMSLRILVVTVGQVRKCSCFLRLDSAAAESELRSNHEVIEFAGDLHFFADVDERWTGPDM